MRGPFCPVPSVLATQLWSSVSQDLLRCSSGRGGAGCEGSSCPGSIRSSRILAGEMLHKGEEVPEDINVTSPLSPLQKGPTFKGTCSCSNPTTAKKTPERGCFRTAGDITRDYYPKQSARVPVGRRSAGEPPGPSMELGTAGLGQRTVIRQYQLSLLSASASWICPGPSQWSSKVDRVSQCPPRVVTPSFLASNSWLPDNSLDALAHSICCR